MGTELFSAVKYPNIAGILIPGKRGQILTTSYIPGGSGPFPTIVVCHGLPGTEQLQDFAVALREKGFCVLCFHYSGCWGSDGDYSMANSLEDSRTVVEYILKNKEGYFDVSRIFILGHSLGGLMASYLLGTMEEAKAGAVIMPANVAQDFRAVKTGSETETELRHIYDDEFAPWLRNFSWRQSKKEAEENISRFDLTSYAEQMSRKPILLIAGTEDEVLPREKHIDVLAAAISAYDKYNLQVQSFHTNHSISMERDQVKAAVCAFFSAQK